MRKNREPAAFETTIKGSTRPFETISIRRSAFRGIAREQTQAALQVVDSLLAYRSVLPINLADDLNNARYYLQQAMKRGRPWWKSD